MITKIFSWIAIGITGGISALGYWGILLAMAIESACVPLPSEIIMPFSGYLVYTGRFDLWLVGLAGAVGCVAGSIIAYGVGIWGGRTFILKYGKYVLVSKKDLEISEKWFEKWGEVTIFLSRLLPVIRTFISLPAGIARMPFWRFVIYTFLGSYPWCLGLAWGGKKLGEHWGVMGRYFHKFDLAIAVVGVVGIVWWIWRHVRNLKEEKIDLSS